MFFLFCCCCCSLLFVLLLVLFISHNDTLIGITLYGGNTDVRICILYFQDVLEELKKYGHKLKYQDTYMSVVQAISRNKNTGEITGFSDERKYPGKAMFYSTEEQVYA